MVKRGSLNEPVIAVARTDWGEDQLRERARASIERHGGGVDEAMFCQTGGAVAGRDGGLSVA